MTEKLVAMRIRAAKTIEGRRDAGQGTLEYIGAIVVAAIVVAAVVAAFNSAFTDLPEKVKTIVNDVFS